LLESHETDAGTGPARGKVERAYIPTTSSLNDLLFSRKNRGVLMTEFVAIANCSEGFEIPH